MYEFWPIIRTKKIESNVHILGVKLHTSEEWRRPFSFLLASNPLIGRMLQGLGAARIPDVSGGDSSCSASRSHCSAERIRRVQASTCVCVYCTRHATRPHTSQGLSLCLRLYPASDYGASVLIAHPDRTVRTAKHLYSTWTKNTFRNVHHRSDQAFNSQGVYMLMVSSRRYCTSILRNIIRF